MEGSREIGKKLKNTQGFPSCTVKKRPGSRVRRFYKSVDCRVHVELSMGQAGVLLRCG